MGYIRVRNVSSLNKVYEETLKNIGGSKDVKTGGALVTFPDKDGNICELSATYMIKAGMFSKEQRVIVVLPFKKDSDGTYVTNLDESVFHIVQDNKGSLQEVWKGNIKEAMNKIRDVAKIHAEAMARISDLNDSKQP